MGCLVRMIMARVARKQGPGLSVKLLPCRLRLKSLAIVQRLLPLQEGSKRVALRFWHLNTKIGCASCLL
jgi:hypothetical protein